MKENLAIVIIPTTPLFSKTESDCFPGMDIQFSTLLHRALYLNYLEFFKDNPVANLFRFVFYESDREKLDQEFLVSQPSDASEIIQKFSSIFPPFFLNNPSDPAEFLPIIEKISQNCSNIILIKADSMGLTPGILSNYTNLLNMDNDVLIVSKSKSGSAVLYGFNNFDENIFSDLFNESESFDDYLKSVSSLDKLFIVQEDLYSVKTIEDFRILYNILSQKEFYSLCSLKIHDLLTDVFIEYKDALK